MSDMTREEAKDNVIKIMDYMCAGNPIWDTDVIKETLSTAISALEQPERKKGKWIHKENVYGVVYCSECDYELHTNDTNFCPDCGADMRGEQDE